MVLEVKNTFLNMGCEKAPSLRRSSTDPCIAPSPPSCKVFVGSLPAQVDEESLRTFMSKFGEVKSAVIKRNLVTGQSRRYGYVRFKDRPKEDLFSGWMMGDKLVRVKPYRPNPCWKNEYHSSEESP